MSSSPVVCALCREQMPDINWNNPCPHWEVAVAERKAAAKMEKNERLREEKERRVYYQDIVHHVCNELDRINGGTILLRKMKSAYSCLGDHGEREWALGNKGIPLDSLVSDEVAKVAECEAAMQAVTAERDDARKAAVSLLHRLADIDARAMAWRASSLVTWPWLNEAAKAGGDDGSV